MWRWTGIGRSFRFLTVRKRGSWRGFDGFSTTVNNRAVRNDSWVPSCAQSISYRSRDFQFRPGCTTRSFKGNFRTFDSERPVRDCDRLDRFLIYLIINCIFRFNRMIFLLLIAWRNATSLMQALQLPWFASQTAKLVKLSTKPEDNFEAPQIASSSMKI